ncbi:brain protein I3-like [Coccinella septempunctata]|uniref:brain protein I3-like n=1 Tax=Coccinella septempunctata TaxID=41139 RepID=UPI001D09711B|nr:brain protein I3-like [Coccinella septempunctata]
MNVKEPPPPYTPNVVPGIHQQGQWQAPPAPQGYPYPQQQWQPAPNAPYPSYGTTTVPPQPTATTVVIPQPEVIIVGGCPACRIGVLEDNYGLCALCCAIAFFPAGILCCLLMKERRCSHCGAIFD